MAKHEHYLLSKKLDSSSFRLELQDWVLGKELGLLEGPLTIFMVKTVIEFNIVRYFDASNYTDLYT